MHKINRLTTVKRKDNNRQTINFMHIET